MLNRIKCALLVAALAVCWATSTIAQNTNAQLLSLISSQLPSGQQTPIANFRTVLGAMVNSTNVTGTTCPTTALSSYQPWANTTSSPASVVLNVFDGASCVPWGLLNASTHSFTLIGSAIISGRHNIIERFGGMDIWQRGAGSSASIGVAASTTAYTVDGCYLTTGANQAATVSSTTGLLPNSNRAAIIQRNSGQTGTGQITFGCPIGPNEIAEAAGSFVSFSFYAQAGANWSPVSGALTANVLCGTGSPVKQTSGYTNQSTVGTTSSNLTTSVARYQVTSSAIVPANCTQMEVQWTWSPTGSAGTNDYFALDSIQLEVAASAGDVASQYAEVSFTTQLLQARRYYNKTFPYGTAPAQNAGLSGALFAVEAANGTTAYMDWRFPTLMRVSPTITTYNPSATNANCRDTTASADKTVTVDPDTAISADHVPITCAAGTAADHLYIHATADAGI